jgi:hypothetical protein
MYHMYFDLMESTIYYKRGQPSLAFVMATELDLVDADPINGLHRFQPARALDIREGKIRF